jgi:hypothetical protein
MPRTHDNRLMDELAKDILRLLPEGEYADYVEIEKGELTDQIESTDWLNQYGFRMQKTSKYVRIRRRGF